jgi:hypothetical protein
MLRSVWYCKTQHGPSMRFAHQQTSSKLAIDGVSHMGKIDVGAAGGIFLPSEPLAFRRQSSSSNFSPLRRTRQLGGRPTRNSSPQLLQKCKYQFNVCLLVTSKSHISTCWTETEAICPSKILSRARYGAPLSKELYWFGLSETFSN